MRVLCVKKNEPKVPRKPSFGKGGQALKRVGEIQNGVRNFDLENEVKVQRLRNSSDKKQCAWSVLGETSA